MKLLSQLLFIVFVFIAHLVYGQTTSLQQSLEAKYENQLPKLQEGIALLVSNGTTTETASFGGYNLSSESVFSIGSATKTFTAVLILQEQEKGNLQLIDSIGTYLSPIKNVDMSLTIASLLAHESGLDEVVGSNIIDIFYSKDDAVYNQNVLDLLEAHQPEKVGTFSYCNTNYMLLGKILEKINDRHYFDLLKERIIDPLQLEHTYPYLHKNIVNLAPPIFNGEDVTAYIDHRFYGDLANAAGSIASTLEDMQVFYTTLFETEVLIKKESLTRMLTDGSNMYGLGIFKQNHSGTMYYGHGGNNIGYAFSNGYNMETKELYMLFSNSISIPIQSIEGDVVDYQTTGAIVPLKKVDITVFKGYEGDYLLEEANMTFTIAVETDKIFLISKAQNIKHELNQKNETTLIDPKTGVRLITVENDMNSLTFSQNGYTTTIKRTNL